MILAAGGDMGLVRLHRLSELQRYRLCATDGEIGAIDEAQFDDRDWAVRYFVARAGNWYAGRSALVSTIALGDIDAVARVIHVQLPRARIMDSPALPADGALTRQFESDYFRYHGWPPYWDSAAAPGPYLPFGASRSQGRPPREEVTHLRSSNEINGYRIAAADGDVGHVSDFIIDEKSWQLSYLVIDTRRWLPQRHVLLNPAWVTQIDWQNGRVVTDLRREAVQAAPGYDPDVPVDRDYEVRLFEYYGRKKYWE